MGFQKITLPNGVRLVMEPMPGVRSAGVGLWLEIGSRDEYPQEAGITHFIEHMLFKGTQARDAFEINDAMNRLGGHFNAFTTQEALCLHAHLIDEQVAEGLDLLAEVLLRSAYPADELDRERMVIFAEHQMILDTPDDLVMEVFHAAMWGDDPLGRSVVGNPESLARLQRADMLSFLEREFTPERLIVSVAGAFDPKAIEAQVRGLFSDLSGSSPERPGKPPDLALDRIHVTRETEQVQFCFGVQTSSRSDPHRYALAVANTILGGGMSSRIFREVREKRGLAYSIGSYITHFRDTGVFFVTGGTPPKDLEKVIKICRREVRSLAKDGPSEAELDLARRQLKASLLFSLENTGARMSQLAEMEMYLGRYIAVDETLRQIEKVTAQDVRWLSGIYLAHAPVALSLVGPENACVDMKLL